MFCSVFKKSRLLILQKYDSLQILRREFITMNKSDKKPCRICGEDINISARKCIHCNSFQDWHVYLGMSTSVLSLLVALVSVVALSVPVIKDAIQPKNSQVTLKFQYYNRDAINLIVSNPGNRPGGIGEAYFDVSGPIDPESTQSGFTVPLINEKEITFIDAGASEQLIFGAEKSSQIREQTGKGMSELTCKLTIPIIEFDGTERKFVIEKNCNDFADFVRNYFW